MISRSSTLRRNRRSLAVVALVSMACNVGVNGIDLQETVGTTCSIDENRIFSGGPGKDGIPALTNPRFVEPDDIEAGYLIPSDRVMGLEIDGQFLAIPLNIMWWHEIVNLDIAGRQLAATHCPLTGSSLVFDRGAADGAEFGVSGLLFQNNLIMYDRNTEESLWPQMYRGSRCGVKDGIDLEMYPSIEMTWDGWETLHPETLVIGSQTAYGRNYRVYPYGNYDNPGNPDLLFPMNDIDRTRAIKERTLGIPHGTAGTAFPFGMLQELGHTAVAQTEDAVVFWDGLRQAAMAYHRAFDDIKLDFVADAGQILDTQTGSLWRIDGTAVSGLLAGRKLDPVADAFVSFWFAWNAFYPNSSLWSAP